MKHGADPGPGDPWAKHQVNRAMVRKSLQAQSPRGSGDQGAHAPPEKFAVATKPAERPQTLADAKRLYAAAEKEK